MTVQWIQIEIKPGEFRPALVVKETSTHAFLTVFVTPSDGIGDGTTLHMEVQRPDPDVEDVENASEDPSRMGGNGHDTPKAVG